MPISARDCLIFVIQSKDSFTALLYDADNRELHLLDLILSQFLMAAFSAKICNDILPNSSRTPSVVVLV